MESGINEVPVQEEPIQQRDTAETSEATTIAPTAPQQRRVALALAPTIGHVARMRAMGAVALLLCLALLGAGSVVLSSRVVHADTTLPAVGSLPAPMSITSRSAAQNQAHLGTESAQSPDTAPSSCICSNTAHAIQVPTARPSNGTGQVVIVSIGQQWLWAFQDGNMVLNSPVTTGQPGLNTPQGTFNVQSKLADTWFYSPWPQGSPYYYTPEHVNYAMLFLQGGYFLHDASWRGAFGPGTNVPHTDPNGQQETGSHGCVNLPVPAAQALYNWVLIGATVQITA